MQFQYRLNKGKHMKVRLPQAENYPLVKIKTKGLNWSSEMLLDQSHKDCEIPLPQGTDENDVEVTAAFCNGRGETVEDAGTLKARVEKPKAPPKPKLEVKPEPKAEPKLEAKTETKTAIQAE